MVAEAEIVNHKAFVEDNPSSENAPGPTIQYYIQGQNRSYNLEIGGPVDQNGHMDFNQANYVGLTTLTLGSEPKVIDALSFSFNGFWTVQADLDRQPIELYNDADSNGGLTPDQWQRFIHVADSMLYQSALDANQAMVNIHA